MWITLWACVGLSVFGLLIGWIARRSTRRCRPGVRLTGAAVATVLILLALLPLTLVGYLAWHIVAGQPTPVARVIRPGLAYERLVLSEPRRAVVHVVTVDLLDHVTLAVTPPVSTPEGPRTRARTTRAAAMALDADVAINASFFRPFRDRHVLDYHPHDGDLVETIGTTIGAGQRHGTVSPHWPTLTVDAAGNVNITETVEGAHEAVSGRSWLLRQGRVVIGLEDEPYPRTVVGLDESRTRLFLVVVDGKQPRYSLGMTLKEVAELLADRGASDAIELDGGGSATLVVRDAAGRHRLFSRPCHTKIPRRERPVANHLVVRLGDPAEFEAAMAAR